MDQVPFSDLRLGQLLAEGGEGRVFEVVSAPPPAGGGPGDVVYKHLRQPRPLAELGAIVSFPAALAVLDAGLAARTWSCSAWPAAAVVGDDPDLAVGTLMHRAPGRFWLTHRDGPPRLATLSYLVSDPDRIDVAYGVHVPGPGTPERVALVYGLCRLVESWQAPASELHVTHGDLSAKNVLWSLLPEPSIYVLDCDGATPGPEMAVAASAAAMGTYDPGHPGPRLRRATTPNWDDPARPAGAGPTEAADRYAIGLAFLRVVGAAHFPLQGRQRAAHRVSVDLELPRSWRRLADMPELWELCERSLSLVNAPERPSPSEWAVQLEQLLGTLGATHLAEQVRRAQRDPRPAIPGPGGAGGLRRGCALRVTVPDVAVRPVLRQRAASTWELIKPRPVLVPVGEMTGVTGAGASAYAGAGGAAGAAGFGPGVMTGLTPREFLHLATSAWGRAHRLALRLLRSPGRRVHGLRRMAGLALVDLVAACGVVFLAAMIVSPWIGL